MIQKLSKGLTSIYVDDTVMHVIYVSLRHKSLSTKNG